MSDFDFNKLQNLLANMSVGLLPKDLTKAEVEFLKRTYGPDWLKVLGYGKGDYKRK